jgi:hypothetical protein
MDEKHYDTEIVLQILFVFYRMLLYPNIDKSLLYKSCLASAICGLQNYPSQVVKVMVDFLLHLIVQHDENRMNLENVAAYRAHDSSISSPEAIPVIGSLELDNFGINKGTDFIFGREAVGPSILVGVPSAMVRARRFAIHNREWLEAVAGDTTDHTGNVDVKLETLSIRGSSNMQESLSENGDFSDCSSESSEGQSENI